MPSIIIDVKCTQCGKVARKDTYDNPLEIYIFCTKCGYNYIKQEILDTKNKQLKLEVDERIGYGVSYIKKTNQTSVTTAYNSEITDKQLQQFTYQLESSSVIKEESYFVIYDKGNFHCVYGRLPKEFLLSFEEYKKKYKQKYGWEKYNLNSLLESQLI